MQKNLFMTLHDCQGAFRQIRSDVRHVLFLLYLLKVLLALLVLRKMQRKIKAALLHQGQLSTPCFSVRMTTNTLRKQQDLQLSISSFLYSLAIQLTDI